MSHQSGLFGDGPPTAAGADSPVLPSPDKAVTLTTLKFSDNSLSPQQKRFNQLLERTELLAGKIEAGRLLTDAHRIVCGAALRPLEAQRQGLMRDMAVWLDDRLKRPGLTRKQQEMVSEVICGLTADLALEGVAGMRDLHDAHSDETLAEQEKASAADTQAFLEEMLGETLDSARDFANPEEVLHASMEQIRQQAEAHDQARAAHKAKRAKGAQKQQAEDADGALRTLYRQLASVLHPDRETDPAEQKRKTTLMSEANAAYARRDLVALLQLQSRADLADARKVSTMATEKIAALTALLKERVDVLARELRDFETRARGEFDLPPHLPLNAAGLRRHMQEEKHALLADIGMMHRDFVRVRDDAEFKRWLRDQQRMAQEEERFERMFR